MALHCLWNYVLGIIPTGNHWKLRRTRNAPFSPNYKFNDHFGGHRMYLSAPYYKFIEKHWRKTNVLNNYWNFWRTMNVLISPIENAGGQRMSLSTRNVCTASPMRALLIWNVRISYLYYGSKDNQNSRLLTKCFCNALAR